MGGQESTSLRTWPPSSSNTFHTFLLLYRKTMRLSAYQPIITLDSPLVGTKDPANELLSESKVMIGCKVSYRHEDGHDLFTINSGLVSLREAINSNKKIMSLVLM